MTSIMGVSFTPGELHLVTAAADRLPIEARQAFMSDVATALAVLRPGARAPLLVDKLLRLHQARAMAAMTDGDCRGDTELVVSGGRRVAAGR